VLILIIAMAFFLWAGDGAAARETEKHSADPGERVYEQKLPRRYSSLDLSLVNFRSEDVPGGSVNALGLALTGGWQLTGIVSLEGGINWIPPGTPFPLPVPLGWMTDKKGIYLNAGAGLRFNLADPRYHATVPWVSVWRMGHAILGDYSTGGKGNTLSAGLEGWTSEGRNWQLAVRFHNFTGDLKIYDGPQTQEYRNTRFRALEVLIRVKGG
jgi:hypothetical protein